MRYAFRRAGLGWSSQWRPWVLVHVAGGEARAAHSGLPSLMLTSTMSKPAETNASTSSMVTSVSPSSCERPKNLRDPWERTKTTRLREPAQNAELGSSSIDTPRSSHLNPDP
jgi:hypothetical protein